MFYVIYPFTYLITVNNEWNTIIDEIVYFDVCDLYVVVSVYIVLAVLHLLLWLGAMAIYLGYVEEEEADQDKNNESTSDTARRKTNKTKNTKK